MEFTIYVHEIAYNADGSKVTAFHTKSLRNFVAQLSSSQTYFTGMVANGHMKEVILIAVFGNERREIHIEFIRGEVKVSEYDVTDRYEEVSNSTLLTEA